MNGKFLNKLLNIGTKAALYREDGDWYHHLRTFPGVLFDKNGYVIFYKADDYLKHPNLKHGHELHVVPSISAMPEYIQFTEEQKGKIVISDKIVDESAI